MKISHNRFCHRISVYLFCAYIIVANTPFLNTISIQIVLFGLWFAFFLLTIHKVTIDWKWIIVFWLGYEIILRAINFSSSAWGNYAIHILYFFPLFVYTSYKDKISEKERNLIWKVYFYSLLLNIISNTFMLIRYPQYNLLLNYSETVNGINLRSLNLGNTMFTYLSTLFSLYCFYNFIYVRKVFFFPFAISAFYIFLSSKTTSVLMLLIGVLILCQIKLSKRVKKGQQFAILLFGCLVIYLMYRYGIPFIASRIDNTNIKERLNAIANGEFGSIYFSRIELAEISLRSFLSSPIFGIGYELIDLSSSAISNLKIGHHSEVIDLLGRYGLIGLCFNFIIYRKYYKYIISLNGNMNQKALGKALLFIILLYSVLNNSIAVETGIFLFYVIPSICAGITDTRQDDLARIL